VAPLRPLELYPSARLTSSQGWKRPRAGVQRGSRLRPRRRARVGHEFGFFLSPGRRSGTNLVMLHPSGRADSVVLVHGTASSPARWADMINDLQNDPLLNGRIQFWLFTYSTSNPILLSASELRAALLDIVKQPDRDSRDPACTDGGDRAQPGRNADAARGSRTAATGSGTTCPRCPSPEISGRRALALIRNACSSNRCRS
jgi:hypothetical protein